MKCCPPISAIANNECLMYTDYYSAKNSEVYDYKTFKILWKKKLTTKFFKKQNLGLIWIDQTF